MPCTRGQARSRQAQRTLDDAANAYLLAQCIATDDPRLLENSAHDLVHRARARELRMKKTWRADFFDDSDNVLPFRSVMIFAYSENDAVAEAAAQMGDTVHFKLEPHSDAQRTIQSQGS